MSCTSVDKFGTIRADKIATTEIVTITEATVIGTLKLSDNLEVGGDGLILKDLEEFTSNENGETITYEDSSTATATVVVEVGETGTDTLTSSVSKTIDTAQDITLNNRTFSITQSGTTVTINKDETKKIISLEQGNLVLATYNVETGERTNKEIIFDSNNSISEINNASYDLKVKSLDVTTLDTVVEDTPSAGDARIDGSLTIGGTITSKDDNSNLLIGANGTGNLVLGTVNNSVVNITGGSFSIAGVGNSSNILLATDAAGEDLTVGITGATDSSLILSSTGTGADAVQLTASAGGMDITSFGIMDISSSNIMNISTSASNSNINILPNGTGHLTLGSDSNTKVDINATEIELDAGVNGLTINSEGTLVINSGGDISIGDNDDSQNISIGTNGTRTITIGQNTDDTTIILAGTVRTSIITESQDPLYVIGGTVSNPPEDEDVKDRGILFKYYDGGVKQGFFGFDYSENEFIFVPDATNTNEVISGTKGTISCATIKTDAIIPDSGSEISFNSGLSVKNGSTSAGFIEFFEDSNNGTNKVTLIGPSSTDDVTITLPSATDTLVGKDTTDTLTNKILTSPTINSATLSGTLSGTPTFSGIGTHSALDVFNAGISVKNGATSAGFIEFFEDSDNGTNKATLIGPASTDDVTITLPAATDTLVGKTTTDTLTNKTLTAPSLTTPLITNPTINNFIIQIPQNINVGGNGITTTDGSYSSNPTSSLIYLQAVDDLIEDDKTYVWNIRDYNPTAGTKLHFFFDNSSDTGVLLKIDFDTNKLVSGNGPNDSLKFTQNGQSASIVYLNNKWRIFNAGAEIL